MRTIVYVDGFNLFYRALKGTSWKWLDLHLLFRTVLGPHHDIRTIKYFTACSSESAFQVRKRLARLLPDQSGKLDPASRATAGRSTLKASRTRLFCGCLKFTLRAAFPERAPVAETAPRSHGTYARDIRRQNSHYCFGARLSQCRRAIQHA